MRGRRYGAGDDRRADELTLERRPDWQRLGRVVAHGLRGRLKVDEPARATLELRRGRHVVRRASLTFGAAATRRFRVRLKPAAATAVSKLSRASVSLRISVRDTAGNVTKVSRTVRLKA